jgi:transcriptional regulator with XRE-family HTH domain
MKNSEWPQQPIFIEKVKAFANANGYVTPRGAVKMDALAKLFDLSESTLKQALYFKKNRRLGYGTLMHIAKTIGCSLSDLTDSPGEPPPNVAQQKWEEISHDDRLFASTVIEDVMSDELTATEKVELFSIYVDMKSRLLRLRKS